MASVISKYPTTLKLPLQFDPHLLHKDIELFDANEWQAHFNRQVYEGDWSESPCVPALMLQCRYFPTPITPSHSVTRQHWLD